MKPHERSASALKGPSPAQDALVWVRAADLNALRDELAAIRRLLSTQAEPPKPHLSEKEAQAYLGCKTTWLWEQRRRGRLKALKVGGKVYYRRTDLDRLIEQSPPA